MADQYRVPFLGEIPLDISIRQGGDSGKPITVAQPDSPHAKAFMSVAQSVAAQVSLATLKAGQEDLIASASIPVIKR